jgi:hypothetical protein
VLPTVQQLNPMGSTVVSSMSWNGAQRPNNCEMTSIAGGREIKSIIRTWQLRLLAPTTRPEVFD